MDDCVEGIRRIARADHSQPLNLGTDELISVDGMVDLVCHIAASVDKRHDVSKPQGVRGRNSDNSRLREVLRWEPATPLNTGMRETYAWIESQVRGAAQSLAAVPAER